MSAAPRSSRFDAIVVGARPAGAGTALVLARRGLRVLAIDRGRHGSDALSTHALMRGGVLQLDRWGVLPRILAADTPAVRAATFVYGDESVRVAVKSRDGLDALYAPRRTVLDRAIVDAAAQAGVELAYGTSLVAVRHDAGGRARGIVARHASGATAAFDAAIVIGADGMHSALAARVDAPVTRRGRWASANVYGYWPGVPADGYRWYYRPGLSAGAIPTNGGLTCIFASVPSSRFDATFRGDLLAGYRRVVTEVAPDLAPIVGAGRPAEPLRGFPGRPGYLRRAAGPGWALVGDAAYFKDPLTAHGLTDALIEAEYLGRAVAAGSDAALAAYADDRDRRVADLFTITDRIASFAWTLEDAPALHEALARAMADEVAALRAFAFTEETTAV